VLANETGVPFGTTGVVLRIAAPRDEVDDNANDNGADNGNGAANDNTTQPPARGGSRRSGLCGPGMIGALPVGGIAMLSLRLDRRRRRWAAG
jgi:hypothetical protein